MARVEPPNNETYADEVGQILCPICHRANVPRARFCQHCGRDVVLNNDGPTYRITRIIKQGGQGAVYEVIGEDRKIYAIKEMLERALNPKELDEAIARFDFEASLLQRLSHPRIPRVYAHFKDEGRSYLAMDFVRGEDLEEILVRGPLPEARVLEIADQICDVLAYLHDNGLIYRDMKPSNIMVEASGNIKLVDFGIAKVFQKSDRATQIGTPGYSPPEQYQGIARIESDIYALGATIHHMLTGRDPRDEAPFSFPPIASLAPKVSRRTIEAVERALQMRPEDRFRSVDDFRKALRPAPVSAPPPIQVRRATNQPAPAPARTQAPPVAPAAQRTIPAAQPATPQPIQPAQPKRRGGFFAAVGRFIRNLLVTTILLVGLAVGVVAGGLFLFPEVTQPVLRPYLPEVVTDLLPATPAPTLPPLISNQISIEVEATVAAGAGEAAVRAALAENFVAAVNQQYGATATVNNNIPIAPVGSIERVATNEDGTETYRATMTGWVQRRE